MIVHGNPAFLAEFGEGCVGLPAAEALIALPRAVFAVMDLVYREGRPIAARLAAGDRRLRMTVVPRRDVETGDVYGIAIRLAPEAGPAGERLVRAP